VLHPRHKLLFYTISHYIWFFCDFNFVYKIQLRLCYNCLRFVNCNIVLLYTFHLRISTRFLRFRNASEKNECKFQTVHARQVVCIEH
jgi:hypothetical protein